MRTEWCKLIVRAQQFKEEVEIVVGEMRWTLAFFEWTACTWEQQARDRLSEPRMRSDVVDGLAAYAARKASVFRKLITVFLQEWYHPLSRKSLGSSWLKDYPYPEIIQRHRLQSNVAAYHSSTQPYVNEADDALLNIPPFDAESGFTADVDSALVNDHPSNADLGFVTDGGINFNDN